MRQFFTEDNNRLSMKRLCGLICISSLCGSVFLKVSPPDILIMSIATTAGACLSLTSIEKIFKK